MESWFDITYRRRHMSRKMSVLDRARVLGKSPLAAAQYLMKVLRKGNSQGVYTLVSISPVVPDEGFANVVARARKAIRRNREMPAARKEIFQAISRGMHVSVQPRVVAPQPDDNDPEGITILL